jgi:small subunit ribosomal protein S4
MRAKQMTRRYYGVLESQFRKYYAMAERKQGKTGEEMLVLLERRLDNVVYRLGWASSRPEARQLVTHGHISVNGKRVDIPSYLVSVGEVISIMEKSRKNDMIKGLLEANASHPVSKWLDENRAIPEAKVVELPKREEIDLPVDETLIVEFYSK